MANKPWKGRRPPKPQLEKYKAARDRRDDAFVNTQVVPYVQHLLDRAQEKTAAAIKLFQGMGTQDIDWSTDGTAYGRRSDALSEAVMSSDSHSTDSRVLYMREHFPELIELIVILGDVDDEIGGQTGDLEPKTMPAAKPTEADLLWTKLTEEDD